MLDSINKRKAEWNKTKNAAIVAYAEVLELNAPLRSWINATPADDKWSAACMAHMRACVALNAEIAKVADA